METIQCHPMVLIGGNRSCHTRLLIGGNHSMSSHGADCWKPFNSMSTQGADWSKLFNVNFATSQALSTMTLDFCCGNLKVDKVDYITLSWHKQGTSHTYTMLGQICITQTYEQISRNAMIE